MLGQYDPEAVLIYARLAAVPGGDKHDLATCTAAFSFNFFSPSPSFISPLQSHFCVMDCLSDSNSQLLTLKPKYHN